MMAPTSELPVGAAKSSPLGVGEIEIASPFEPDVVLENLRARGREWRASAVPEDLRPYNVTNLTADVSGSEFALRWVGSASSFYSPVCFGVVERTSQGSSIKARFKRDLKAIKPILFLFPLAILQFASDRSAVTGLLVVAWVLILASMARGRNHKGPLCARLIDVLTTAARQKPTDGSPFSSTMSTNGP
jgi:hypothetical protein